jgi:hypothetical protein
VREQFPRVMPKDDECAAMLTKRTLTSLYNERPGWLEAAHKKLDAVVLAAYGWSESVGDDEVVAKLLAMNLEREPAP